MAGPDPYADALALLSANLHRLMEEKNVSVRDLVRASGVNPKTLRLVLKFPNAGGIRNPSLSTVALWAFALKVPVADLLSHLPPPPQP